MFWGVGRESPVTGRTGAGGPWSLHTDVLGTEHQPPSLELQESRGSEGHRLFCIAQTQFFLLKYRQLSGLHYGLVGGSLVVLGRELWTCLGP